MSVVVSTLPPPRKRQNTLSNHPTSTPVTAGTFCQCRCFKNKVQCILRLRWASLCPAFALNIVLVCTCRSNRTSVTAGAVFQRPDAAATPGDTAGALQAVRRNPRLHAQVRRSQGEHAGSEVRVVTADLGNNSEGGGGSLP